MPFLYKETYEDFYYVDNVFVHVQINTALLILMIVLRTYHIYRCILVSSYYMSDRAIRMCFVFGVNNDYTYAFRALFRDNPYLF